MKFACRENGIEIFGKDDFCPSHICECGQIFSFEKTAEMPRISPNFAPKSPISTNFVHTFDVFLRDKRARIFETESGFFIETDAPAYFVDFFDLQTDYSQIKSALLGREMMKKPIEFGHGIRILKQDLFETLISFIVSANNNIKRIQLILNRMRRKFGTCMGEFFAFPTHEQLLKASEADFAELGAGYRAKYLFKVLRQVDEAALVEWKKLPTAQLRNKLISLSGVGPKVADCVLLFGYGRGDVFPVDTWIEKVFHHFYGNTLTSREKIREFLTSEFGELSGYAQQYLFFFFRSSDRESWA